MTIDLKKLEDLVRARIKAKRDEDVAAEIRKGLDADIAAIIKPELKAKGKEYGSVTQKLEAAGVKVGVSFGYDRKFLPAFVDDVDTLPAPLRELAKWKPEVVNAKWEELSATDKVAASKYVETKPSSPSIKIEVL